MTDTLTRSVRSLTSIWIFIPGVAAEVLEEVCGQAVQS